MYGRRKILSMNNKSIIEDAMSTFSQNSSKFWKNDEELVDVLDEIMQEQSIETGADVFSITQAILTNSSKFIKKQGQVDSCVWKTIIKSERSKVFKSLSEDYEATMEKLRKQYPAPLPEVLLNATEILDQVKEFITIKDIAESEGEEETLTYIKETSSELIKQILELFKELSVVDTLYMKGTNLIETYKKIVIEALDTLKILNTPKVKEEEVA